MRNLVDAWFKRLVVINLVLVFIVVIAGSIVRVTESGMGCPDWPKCFGAYIPPTSEDQVTWHEGEDFFEGQMIIHEEKLYNAKKDLTASTSFNPAEWAEFTKHGYATYNPVHTWIEFINRLATVALGFPVMALFALSFFYWKDRRARVYLSFAVVFLVGFQAWLGKLVVDSNLKGQTITLHMIGVFCHYRSAAHTASQSPQNEKRNSISRQIIQAFIFCSAIHYRAHGGARHPSARADRYDSQNHYRPHAVDRPSRLDVHYPPLTRLFGNSGERLPAVPSH